MLAVSPWVRILTVTHSLVWSMFGKQTLQTQPITLVNISTLSHLSSFHVYIQVLFNGRLSQINGNRAESIIISTSFAGFYRIWRSGKSCIWRHMQTWTHGFPFRRWPVKAEWAGKQTQTSAILVSMQNGKCGEARLTLASSANSPGRGVV